MKLNDILTDQKLAFFIDENDVDTHVLVIEFEEMKQSFAISMVSGNRWVRPNSFQTLIHNVRGTRKGFRQTTRSLFERDVYFGKQTSSPGCGSIYEVNGTRYMLCQADTSLLLVLNLDTYKIELVYPYEARYTDNSDAFKQMYFMHFSNAISTT